MDSRGLKDWVADAPVSRILSLIVGGGPAAPWVLSVGIGMTIA